VRVNAEKKEKMREFLGEKAKDLSNKELAAVYDGYYSLAYFLVEWCKEKQKKYAKRNKKSFK